METTLNSKSERVFSIIEKVEEVFITVSGIAIGLSTLLVLV